MTTQTDYAVEANKFVTNVMGLNDTVYGKISDDDINNFAETAITPFMDKNTACLLSRIVLKATTAYYTKQPEFTESCSALGLPNEFVIELYTAVITWREKDMEKIVNAIRLQKLMGERASLSLNDGLNHRYGKKNLRCVIM